MVSCPWLLEKVGVSVFHSFLAGVQNWNTFNATIRHSKREIPTHTHIHVIVLYLKYAYWLCCKLHVSCFVKVEIPVSFAGIKGQSLTYDLRPLDQVAAAVVSPWKCCGRMHAGHGQ